MDIYLSIISFVIITILMEKKIIGDVVKLVK